MSHKVKEILYRVESLEETETLAKIVADFIRDKRMCLELVGDVGAGKTTFTQYLVHALGSDTVASSPTFTLENQYTCRDNIVHHFDLYRLEESGILPEEVREALVDDKSITVIEWADVIRDKGILPDDRIIIEFQPLAESETARKIRISSENSGFLQFVESSVSA